MTQRTEETQAEYDDVAEQISAIKATSDMTDVCAMGVKYTVVSCKKPGEFILRGIKKWSTVEGTRARMEKYVAILDQADLEWTFHEYMIPHYMEYGSGDIPARCNRPIDGVYIHRILCTTSTTCDSYGDGQRIEGW